MPPNCQYNDGYTEELQPEARVDLKRVGENLCSSCGCRTVFVPISFLASLVTVGTCGSACSAE